MRAYLTQSEAPWPRGRHGRSGRGGPGEPQPWVLTGDIFDELCDGGVVCQRAAGGLHVGQLGDELLDLPHRLGVVPLLEGQSREEGRDSPSRAVLCFA